MLCRTAPLLRTTHTPTTHIHTYRAGHLDFQLILGRGGIYWSYLKLSNLDRSLQSEITAAILYKVAHLDTAKFSDFPRTNVSISLRPCSRKWKNIQTGWVTFQIVRTVLPSVTGTEPSVRNGHIGSREVWKLGGIEMCPLVRGGADIIDILRQHLNAVSPTARIFRLQSPH